MNNNIKHTTNGNNTYYHKYLKYKKKYLELSQTNKLLGGRPTPTLVSGPVSFRHLHNLC